MVGIADVDDLQPAILIEEIERVAAKFPDVGFDYGPGRTVSLRWPGPARIISGSKADGCRAVGWRPPKGIGATIEGCGQRLLSVRTHAQQFESARARQV